LKLKLTSILQLILILNVQAQNLDSLPLFDIQDLTYKGAFRISAETFGISSMNYAQGPIAYNKTDHSIYIVGHSHQQAIAEFEIPELVISDQLSDLNIVDTPLQTFTEVLNRPNNGNSQNLDRIGGMYLNANNGAETLIVNAFEYYDAPADNTLSTLIIQNPNDLAGSDVSGYYSFRGGAGHTSGWLSPVPLEWKNLLESDFITGQSSGWPIIARLSVGPSAFGFSMKDLLSASNQIETKTLLDFDLENALSGDLENTSGNNDIWTHLSRATYGFIIPSTRTYFTIGQSGGHSSGVCYKCTQNNGNLCGGYCPPDAEDLYHYYWLWDVNDLLKVKSGEIESHEVLPYDFGEFVVPFQSDIKEIGGASYDIESGDLYMTIQQADDEQGQYSNPPIIAVYSTNLISAVDVYLWDDEISLYPNPTKDLFEIRGPIKNFTIQILDSVGNVHQEMTSSSTDLNIDISDLPNGLYFVHIKNKINAKVFLDKIVKQ